MQAFGKFIEQKMKERFDARKELNRCEGKPCFEKE
jgi:hypothetical protein